jgi:hypothetical protein
MLSGRSAHRLGGLSTFAQVIFDAEAAATRARFWQFVHHFIVNSKCISVAAVRIAVVGSA